MKQKAGTFSQLLRSTYAWCQEDFDTILLEVSVHFLRKSCIRNYRIEIRHVGKVAGAHQTTFGAVSDEAGSSAIGHGRGLDWNIELSRRRDAKIPMKSIG